MNKKILFLEGVVISWRKELQIGNPLRIARLAFFTVWYGIEYFVIVAWRNVYIAFFAICNRLVRFVIVILRALIGKTDWRK